MVKNDSKEVYATSQNVIKPIFPTVIATAKGKKGLVNVRLLLDTCSSVDYVTVGKSKSITNKIIEEKVPFKLTTLTGTQNCNYDLIEILLVTPVGQTIPIQSYVKNDLPIVEPIEFTNEMINNMCVKKNIVFGDQYPRTKPIQCDMLISVQTMMKIIGTDPIKLTDQLQLLPTKWGYVLMGAQDQTLMKKGTTLMSRTEVLTKQLERMWLMEKMPYDDDTSGLTQEEVNAVELINDVCTYNSEERKFETSLLFKSGKEPKLQNNFRQAKARLDGMLRKIKNDDVVKRGYVDSVQEYLDADIVEEVVDPNADNPHRTDVYYLAHRIITDTSRITTKFRLVWDAGAAAPNGKSLNHYIYTGPKLQTDIVGILMRLRSRPITLFSDVSKMFLNVKVKGKHKDFLRFLYKNPFDNNASTQLYRFKTLVMGVVDSPFQALTVLQKLVQRKLDDSKSSTFEKHVCREMLRNFYMDDCTLSCSNEEEAIKMRKAIQKILAEGTFIIRKWISNSQKVLKTIPDELKAPVRKMQLFASHEDDESEEIISDTCKQLGYRYDPEEDEFLFDTYGHITKTNTNDMTSVASLLAKIYDPLGFLSPFILQARKLLKPMYIHKKGWLDPLIDEVMPDWKLWLKQIPYLDQIKVPRYMKSKPETEYFIYGDASSTGYGACVYARTKDEETGSYESHLVLAKSHISPVKELTIPRMELCATKLATELGRKVQLELDVPKEKIHIFSDSEIVNFWLHKPLEKLIPYVHNRVAKIREAGYDCRYVHTDDNPADIASKGASIEDLLNSKLWWHGPNYLRLPEDEWPKCNKDFAKLNILDGIRKSDVYTHVYTYASLSTILFRKPIKDNPNDIRQYFKIPIDEKYSDYATLKNKMSKLYYYIAKWSAIVKNKAHNADIAIPEYKPEAPDFNLYKHKALNYWIKLAQEHAFGKEIEALKNDDGKKFTRKTTLKKLHPYIDSEGIMRVGGRLQHTKLPFATKHQIILPKNHLFTKALIRNMHLVKEHSTVDETHFQLRTTYWILQSRQAIKKVLKTCFGCARFNTPKLQQLMSPFAEARSHYKQSWMHVGIDLTGDISIRKYPQNSPYTSNFPDHPRKIKNPEMTKAYVVLFTCLVTRAIHMEIVLTNHAEEFMNAFIRFTNVCGMGTDYYSDGAKNFISASKQLKIEVAKRNQHRDGQDLLTFKWHFQTPHAGHVGGLWERLIKHIKHSLYKATMHAKLTYQELETVIRKISGTTNDRPLLKVSEEESEVITPSMLTIGRRIRPWADDFMPKDEKRFTSEDLQTRWTVRQKVNDAYWDAFMTSYLADRQERGKWHEEKPNLKIGDVVLVSEKNIKRYNWKTARVTNVFVGKDGRVRSAEIFKAYEPHKLHRKSIQHLYPLECVTQIDDPYASEDNAVANENTDNDNNVNLDSAAIQHTDISPNKGQKLKVTYESDNTEYIVDIPNVKATKKLPHNKNIINGDHENFKQTSTIIDLPTVNKQTVKKRKVKQAEKQALQLQPQDSHRRVTRAQTKLLTAQQEI